MTQVVHSCFLGIARGAMFWCHWTLLVPRVVACVPQPILLARGPSPSTSPRLRARAGRRAVSLEPMDVDPPAGPSTARSLCGSWPRCWLDEAEWPPISGTGVPTVRPPASPRPEAPWPAFAAASPAPGGDVPLAVAPGGGDPPAPAGEEGSRRTGPGGGPPAAPAAGPSAAAPARSSGPLLGGPPLERGLLRRSPRGSGNSVLSLPPCARRASTPLRCNVTWIGCSPCVTATTPW